MRSAYKHWSNSDEKGDTCFITTTCLDFAKLFERDEMKSRILSILCNDCIHYKAILHAYVIMPHHIHAIITAPKNKTLPWLMQRIKTNSSKHLINHLNEREMLQLGQQSGLNSRQIWMRSFRSFAIRDQKAFIQKLEYIHNNPVADGLVRKPEDYLWSSCGLFTQGAYDPDFGLAEYVMDTLHTASVEG